MSARTVHGGSDSALSVEIMPVIITASGIDTCPGAPERATGYGVYIRNPLAMHVRDFRAMELNGNASPETRQAMRGRAYAQAFTFAATLAEHLGCALESAGGFK